MTTLYTSPTLELLRDERGQLWIRCSEVGHGGQDAAAAIDVATLRALLSVVDPQPAVASPDSLGPVAATIAAELVQCFEALKELAKSRPGECDYLLRYFVKHVGAWRGWCLKEAA